MRTAFGWIIAFGCTSFLLVLSSYVSPELICVLLSLLILAILVALLVVASLWGFIKWRTSSRFWLFPALVCLGFLFCSLYVAAPVGQHVSDSKFKKHIGEYASLVRRFEDGRMVCASLCEGDLRMMEASNLPARVGAVWGAHCDGGGSVVLFLLDTDVPLLHEGYIYRNYEESSDCSKRRVASDLAYVRHMAGPWYRVSDQPGF